LIKRRGVVVTPKPAFGHAVSHELPNGQTLIGCYHPSRQNTITGKLTAPMMDTVFARTRRASGSDPGPTPVRPRSDPCPTPASPSGTVICTVLRGPLSGPGGELMRGVLLSLVCAAGLIAALPAKSAAAFAPAPAAVSAPAPVVVALQVPTRRSR